MADRWEQFKRVTDFANAWAAGGGRVLRDTAVGIKEALPRLANRQPGDEFTDENARDALVLGPGMLLPAFARAAGGIATAELGALGGQRMRPMATPTWPHSDKAMQVAQTMAQEGVGATQIADTLTRYYTPSGVSVSIHQVKKLLDAQGLTKAELPTTNAFRARAPGVTDEVRQGIFNVVRDAPKDAPIETLIEKVRSQYPGLPATDERLTSLLTRAKRVAGAEPDVPRQLKLLSGGAPGGWAPTVTRADEQLPASDDERLISDTRALTDKVKSAADEADAAAPYPVLNSSEFGVSAPAARFARPIEPPAHVWNQFQRVETGEPQGDAGRFSRPITSEMVEPQQNTEFRGDASRVQTLLRDPTFENMQEANSLLKGMTESTKRFFEMTYGKRVSP